MGIARSTPEIDPDSINTMLNAYKVGDIDAFVRIANYGKNGIKNKKFHAWRIGCLYRFLTTLPEDSHDIDYSQADIISQYAELKASTDSDIMDGLRIAGC